LWIRAIASQGPADELFRRGQVSGPIAVPGKFDERRGRSGIALDYLLEGLGCGIFISVFFLCHAAQE